MTPLDQIGIGIPTRDRWDELALTLRKLAEYGLGANETIVLDDGSRELLPEGLREEFPHVRFERTPQSRYVTGSRNDLARMLSKPLFLQIDNDSFPVSGDLAAAAAWLSAQPDALALAFIIAEREDYQADAAALSREPVPCHYFVGCSALIKRELFLKLGGYEESLGYMAEEIALALHAQAQGFQVYQYPTLVVRHLKSPLSRDLGVRAELNVRNELLIAGLFYPFVFMLLRWPVYLLKALLRGWFPPKAVLGGAVAAARLYPQIWSKRDPATLRTFLRWKRLPAPIQLD